MTAEQRIRAKIIEVRDEAEAAMMDSSDEAHEASGRFAACSALLAGMTPEDAAAGCRILPKHWPQYRGWLAVIKQFKGLL
ncbi:MAG: hypothetical protein AB7F40_10265 [Victivallaceae bacterium]